MSSCGSVSGKRSEYHSIWKRWCLPCSWDAYSIRREHSRGCRERRVSKPPLSRSFQAVKRRWLILNWKKRQHLPPKQTSRRFQAYRIQMQLCAMKLVCVACARHQLTAYIECPYLHPFSILFNRLPAIKQYAAMSRRPIVWLFMHCGHLWVH